MNLDRRKLPELSIGRQSLTIPSVTAPVVVILAAGQGTRMRSDVQKLLHPLCGMPIIAWPVAAARAAGAAKDRKSVV